MSLLSPEGRRQLVLPYDDYDLDFTDTPPAHPAPGEIIARMAADAGEAAAAGEAGKNAAAALVVAVGNYEWVSFQRGEIIDACEKLLDRYDPNPRETRRWG
jgi:hypothetical protein